MENIQNKKVKLFTLSSNVDLANEISNASGIPISLVEISRFSDGEINLSIPETVRGNDVFVVQSTSNPANEHLMELLVMSDALKRASAKSVTLIVPYFGYARQDHKDKSRQPISAKLVADMIQVAGANRVVSIDLHSQQIQGFFNIPIDNFPAGPYLASYFKKLKLKDLVIVSPDHGGVTRARVFASNFRDASIAIIDKKRSGANRVEKMSLIGDVTDKSVIIIDDIIDTANTMAAAADVLIKAGAKEVYGAATHGVLSGDAVSTIKNSKIKTLVISNTIYIPEEKRVDKIKVLPIGSLLGKAIVNIIKDEPISQIFEKIGEEWN